MTSHGGAQADTSAEIEIRTDEGHRVVVAVAPGYSRQDALAELPAIRRAVDQTLARRRQELLARTNLT